MAAVPVLPTLFWLLFYGNGESLGLFMPAVLYEYLYSGEQTAYGYSAWHPIGAQRLVE